MTIMVIPNKLLMIDILLKLVLITVFVFIFFQDSKDRLVYWFLYPLAGVLSYTIQAITIGWYIAILNSLINLGFIAIILSVGFLYSKLIMKKKFVDESIGLGDILLFLFLCFTFSTIPYIILFVFSLLFSLLLHNFLKKTSHPDTVPLAGYITLFFAAVYFISLFISPKYLFA